METWANLVLEALHGHGRAPLEISRDAPERLIETFNLFTRFFHSSPLWTLSYQWS